MLAKPDVKVAFDESGKAIGVTSEGQTAKAKLVSNAVCQSKALGSQPIYLPIAPSQGCLHFSGQLSFSAFELWRLCAT